MQLVNRKENGTHLRTLGAPVRMAFAAALFGLAETVADQASKSHAALGGISRGEAIAAGASFGAALLVGGIARWAAADSGGQYPIKTANFFRLVRASAYLIGTALAVVGLASAASGVTAGGGELIAAVAALGIGAGVDPASCTTLE